MRQAFFLRYRYSYIIVKLTGNKRGGRTLISAKITFFLHASPCFVQGHSPNLMRRHGFQCNNTMIRKNLINCKLIHEKRCGKTIFDEYMKHLQAGMETCPNCGSKGELHIHAYYGRTLIEFIDGRPVKIRLCICRLACSQCSPQSTHAILPDPIIPYCRHSLFFILRVLAEHALHLHSVEKICEVYEISLRTFYRWQKLFNAHRAEWQGLLDSMESSLKEAILELVQREPFSTFAAGFFKLTGFSILQAHANPSQSRRRSPADPSDFY